MIQKIVFRQRITGANVKNNLQVCWSRYHWFHSFYGKLIHLISKNTFLNLLLLQTFTGFLYWPGKMKMLKKLKVIPALGMLTVGEEEND